MRFKKQTTHKVSTKIVHFICLAAALYIFYVWQRGIVSDAAEMLKWIAWVEITNITQYAAKSGYDHKNGIFDNPVAAAAMQAAEMNDLVGGPTQIVEAARQQDEKEIDNGL